MAVVQTGLADYIGARIAEGRITVWVACILLTTCSLNRCNYLHTPVGKTHRMLRKILNKNARWDTLSVAAERSETAPRSQSAFRSPRHCLRLPSRNRVRGRRGLQPTSSAGCRRTHGSGYMRGRQRHHRPARVHLHHYTLYIVHRWWGYGRGVLRSAHSKVHSPRSLHAHSCRLYQADKYTGADSSMGVLHSPHRAYRRPRQRHSRQLKHGSPSSILPSQSSSMLVP